MKINSSKGLMKMIFSAMILSLAGCHLQQEKKKSSSSLMSLNTQVKSPIDVGGDPKALCAYLKNQGYFPRNSYAPGTKALFSTSYEIVDDAAGQGFGVVGADGFFEQQGNTTSQLLLCPGASNLSGGKCAWQMNGQDGYAQLAFDVVCNARSRRPQRIHPGYSRQSAQLVSYTAKTAGQSTSGNDAVEVLLEGRESKARIVFAKGVGLVAVVFQEGLMPAGTAEVFIGGSGAGNMFGDGGTRYDY